MRYIKKTKKNKKQKKQRTKKFLQKGGILLNNIAKSVLDKIFESINYLRIKKDIFDKIVSGEITIQNYNKTDFAIETDEEYDIDLIKNYLIYIQKIVIILKNTVEVISNMRDFNKIKGTQIIYDNQINAMSDNERILGLTNLLLTYDGKKKFKTIESIQQSFGKTTKYLLSNGELLDLFRVDNSLNLKGSIPFIVFKTSFYQEHSDTLKKCISGPNVIFPPKKNHTLSYIENYGIKDKLNCGPDKYPKYENDKYCCVYEKPTDQELLDYINNKIEKAMEVQSGITFRFSIIEIINKRNELLKNPILVDNLELPLDKDGNQYNSIDDWIKTMIT